MKTEKLQASEEGIRRAGEILREGGLVAVPTETVYGLAADALNGPAVAKIFAAKGRPVDNPLIVHISEEKQILSLVKEYPERARRLAAAYWPGPLTMILPKADCIPDEVSAGLPTVAIRFPSHSIARKVIDSAGTPLAAPSANSSGKPSPTCAEHVRMDLDGKIDAILDGGDCGVGVESTVVTLAGKRPRLLRPGGITPAQLIAVLGDLEIDPAVTHQLAAGQKAASPGMKYKHYAPNASLTLVKGNRRDYCRFVNMRAADGCFALCFSEDMPLLKVSCVCYGDEDDSASQARNLFEALRELDRRGAKTVYAHCPSAKGVGLAVYNRIVRAAGFSIVEAPVGIVLGLTGPTGAGKSLAAEVFREENCAVVDADKIAREVVCDDTLCLFELAKTFGAEVLNADGSLNRAELAARAFSSPEKEELLNKITHPRILKRISQQIDAYFAKGVRCVAVDAPLLFESGGDAVCGAVLAVLANKDTRCTRIQARDGISREAALRRISVQQSDEFYQSRADRTLWNDGTAEDFRREVRAWLKSVLA